MILFPIRIPSPHQKGKPLPKYILKDAMNKYITPTSDITTQCIQKHAETAKITLIHISAAANGRLDVTR